MPRKEETVPSKQKGAQSTSVAKASIGKATAAAAATPKPAQQQAPIAGVPGDGISMLKQDHRKVDALFTRYEAEGADKASLRRQICHELMIHTTLEEEIFYPACRQNAEDAEDELDEAQVEHDSAKMLIIELLEAADDDEYLDAKVKVLAEQVRTHVKEEEAADGVFAKAQSAGINNPDLARRLRERKSALLLQAESDELPKPQLVSFQYAIASSQQMENHMSRGNYSGRDDRGRFTGDDDRGYGRSSSGRGSSSSRSRYDDDDRRYSRGNDDGRGWYGDPEGHSEASRRGWENRDDNGYRGRGRDDDDRYYSSRGRDDDGRFGGRARDDEGRFTSSRGRDDDDDGRGRSSRGRGQGGWFGDPEGHSEASRRGWESRDDDRGGRYSSRGRDDDDYRRSSRSSGDRGQGGWFGDPEGHSEASRRGWEHRDDDRGSSRSRGRDDDDYRRSSRSSRDDDDDGRGHGRGGWFGDSEGHSEASRRGWESRR